MYRLPNVENPWILGLPYATEHSVKTEQDKIREYLMKHIESNEAATSHGYDKNESFVDEVMNRYLENLNYLEPGYAEFDARDEAIKAALEYWLEKEAER